MSTTQISATIASAILQSGGVFNITLSDPLGVSASPLPFTVMNPIPDISSIQNIVPSPHGIVGKSPPHLRINGTGFVAGTELLFNNIAVSGGTLSNGGNTFTITVPAADITAVVGSPGVTVSVVNPLPGGGTAAESFDYIIDANTGPEAVLTPSPLVFPGQNPGTTSAVMNVTITNTGGATLTLNAPAPSFGGTNPSYFALTAPTTGTPCIFTGSGTIAAGGAASCTFGG